jgi:hypothetical protein
MQAVGFYWVPAMTEACFEGWHLSVAVPLGVVGLVFVTIGFPLTLLLALLWERRQPTALPQQPSNTSRPIFSFLTEQFAPHAWYWAPVAATQITALVAVAKLGLQLQGGPQLISVVHLLLPC